MKAKRTGLYSVVAVAGALSVGTAPAWTQQSGQKSPQDRASQSRQQAEMSRNLVSVEHLKDQEVLDTNNREVGNISGVYINPQSGRVERVGIEFSDSMFGRDHKYSVGWDKLKVRKQGDETLVTLDQSVIQRVQQAGKSGRVQEGDGIYAWRDEPRSSSREEQRSSTGADRNQQERRGGVAGIGADRDQGSISGSQLSAEQIRKVQQKLNQEGFHAGQVDGNWNSQTQTAIRNFQQTKGLKASGQLDERTIDELGLDADEFRDRNTQQSENRSGATQR